VKKPKKICLEGFGAGNYKYFKPKPELQYYLVVLTTLDEPARNGKVHTPRTGQDGVRPPNNVPDASGLTDIH